MVLSIFVMPSIHGHPSPVSSVRVVDCRLASPPAEASPPPGMCSAPARISNTVRLRLSPALRTATRREAIACPPVDRVMRVAQGTLERYAVPVMCRSHIATMEDK